jgi:hypothetical protein
MKDKKHIESFGEFKENLNNMTNLQQHQRAFKDLSFKQKTTVIAWIFCNWKRLKKYHRCVITQWYGDKAFLIAQTQ